MLQFIIDLMLISFYGFLTISVFVYVRRFWGLYVAQSFINKTQEDTIMLEIKLPREIDKSPLAMEMILPYLAQSSGLSWYSQGMKGATPVTFSLEIASLEGVVHFYVRGHKKFKELITSAFYAHYPGVEVVEAEDYTTKFPRYEHNKTDVSMWGNGFTLSKKYTFKEEGKEKKNSLFWFDKLFRLEKQKDSKKDDVELPCDAYPIRTYVDLELDKQKEEMKVDPLVSVLEFFGSLGKGEYAGLQILLQDPGVYSGKPGKMPKMYHHPETHEAFSFHDIAGLEIKANRTKETHEKGKKVEDQYGNPVMEKGDEKTQLTYKKDVEVMYGSTDIPSEKKAAIEAIQTKMTKPLLACVMRVVYCVDNKKGKFNANQIQNCLNLTKPFNAPGYNFFSPREFAGPYDFDWQDPKKVRGNWRAEEVFDAYIEREGFHPHLGLIDWFSGRDADHYFFNFKGYVRRTVTIVAEAILSPFGHPHAEGVFHLNTEELATIWHLPGLVASVPTLPRIDSRKSVAPVNLPQ